MVRIRQTIARMEAEETALESPRAAAYQVSIRRTMTSIYLASLLAALGVIFLGYCILREINIRERHAQELRASATWFRVTLTSIGDAVIATDQVKKYRATGAAFCIVLPAAGNPPEVAAGIDEGSIREWGNVSDRSKEARDGYIPRG